MTTYLVLTIIVILLLLIIVFKLFYEIRKLEICINEDNDNGVLLKLAYTDALTGIYNRTAYNKHMSDVNKADIADGLGIMLFDIDDFKTINDTKGHLEGDETLKFVAKILTLVFDRPQDCVYRIGGDEFAVISKNITEDQLITSLICLRQRMEKESDIRLSCGYSMIKKNINSSYKYADEMLYADKLSKKNNLSRYTK